MPLPAEVRVKISTEDAASIAITPVVVRQMPLRELVEHILCITGYRPGRVSEQLRRGSLVRGASRFRWEPLEARQEDLLSLLASFPLADPQRPFAADECASVRLHGAGLCVTLPRAVGRRTRLLQRRSFWSVLMEIASAGSPSYVEYSYSERADAYTLALDRAASVRLNREASLLAYAGLARQIGGAVIESIEFFVPRSS